MTKNKSSTAPKTESHNYKAGSKHLYSQYTFPLYLVFYIFGIAYIVFSIFTISNNSSNQTGDSGSIQSKLNSPANKSTLDFIEEAKSPDEAAADSPFANQDKTKLKDVHGRINPLNAKDNY
jgi:hypothetical protein